MTAHRLAGPLVVGIFFFIYGASASAQSCPATNFTGTVTPGDGSQPSENFHLGAGHCCGYFGQTQGPPGDLSLYISPGFPGWEIHAWSSPYFEEVRPGVDCVENPVTQCVTCSPAQMNIELYALLGNFVGTVISKPSNTCGGHVVIVDYGPRSATANVDPVTCRYSLTDRVSDPRYKANHWAVELSRAPGATGPGSATRWVYLDFDWSTGQFGTTYSSQDGVVNFCAVAPGTEATDTRSSSASSKKGIAPDAPVCPGPEGCAAVGLPVSVVSGNMYFDQTDATVMGLGGLTFARSYNSANRAISSTLFGGGWFSSYEKRLEIQSSSLLKLRRGDGVAAYFTDPQGHLRFDASLPFSRESWIVKQPDATYVLHFRAGGTETYDAAGRLKTMTDTSGNVTTLAYDASFRLRTITAPSGRVLTLAYDNGRPSTLSGPAGLIATYTYDASSRLATITYADTAASGYVFTYDTATGAIATVSDLSGRFIEKHSYDGAGNAATSEIADGRELYTFTYQPTQTVVTDALGNTTTYEYAMFGGQRRVTRIVGPCDGCPGGTETGRWTYTDWTSTATDPIGKVTTYTYDPATGDLPTVTDPLSNTTTYTYDAAGRVLTRGDASGGLTTYVQSAAGPTSVTEKVTATQSRTTNIAYRPDGLISTVTDARGKMTSLAYNAAGDLVTATDPLLHATQFEYDALGRRTKVTDPLMHATQTAYDIRGHVTQVTDAVGKHIDFAYDAGGRRTSVTDALGRTTQYAYDPYGRLATVTDALAGTTQYGYDAMSNLISLTDAKSHTTTFEYDAFRRVKKVVYPGAAFETFTYDPAGRVRTRTDRRQIVTTFDYDEAGRLHQKGYSDGTPTVTYSYDAVGRILTAASDVDTVTWTYDFVGQKLSEASAYGAANAYTYDLGGNRLTVDNALTIGYGYDDDSRLTSITRGTQIFSISYDQAHRRTSLSYPNGAATTYGYDNLDRLTSLSTTLGATPIASFAYSYNEVGNRLSKTTSASAESYAYDGLDRLTQVSHGATTTEQYTYDAVGNRLSSSGETGWTYNDRNQLLARPDFTYLYDENGNRTRESADGSYNNYFWDAENRLTSMTDPNDTLIASFMYDPLGRRLIKKAGSGSRTTYSYDGEDIVGTLTRPGSELPMQTHADYVHGPGIDEWLSRDDSTFYHADALGSIVMITDPSGSPASDAQYDAFGNTTAIGEPAFTGREFDDEIGLYYYRARYYDPKAGRFLSEDPIGLAAGPNRYTYVDNDPTTFTDPSGLVRLRVEWKVVKGSGDFVGRVGDASPSCERDCSGKYRLQFVLPVTLTLYIGGGPCRAYAETHERLHASMFLGNLNLRPLEEAEGRTYNSYGECYQAAYAAVARFNRAPFNPSYRPNQRWVDWATIPCGTQF